MDEREAGGRDGDAMTLVAEELVCSWLVYS